MNISFQNSVLVLSHAIPDFRTSKHADIISRKSSNVLDVTSNSTKKTKKKKPEILEGFKKIINENPENPQSWLDFVKHWEEKGNFQRSREAIIIGLNCCPDNEQLLIKWIKLEEKLGNLARARSVLGLLKNSQPEKSWKIILEGCFLEDRAGNYHTARRIFKEACLFEERHENIRQSIIIAEKGLRENVTYGPLHLALVRLEQKLAFERFYDSSSSNSVEPDLSRARFALQRAIQFVPKELRFKIFLEWALLEDRVGNTSVSRKAFVHSVANCPANLLWKVWLEGAKVELRNHMLRLDTSRETAWQDLIARSLRDCPTKKKHQVLIEWSRMEEFCGRVDIARSILSKARKYAKHEWKVFLESILLEMRANSFENARTIAEQALSIHRGTGRLWHLLIQLTPPSKQFDLFTLAIHEVPKSGEVWTEGARIKMKEGLLDDARRFLEFAIHFTPQYGDSFIEFLRLEMMQYGFTASTEHLELACVNADPNYGQMWLFCKEPLQSTHHAFRTAKHILQTTATNGLKFFELNALNPYDISLLIDLEDRWRLIFGDFN